MKILYGIQGTGNGHIARSRVMSAALKSRHIDVDYFFSGRADNAFFSMECFGHYQSKRGLTFKSSNGQINYLATARTNHLGRFFRDIRQCDLAGYDLVVNDFEPISAWAAKRQHTPCISISHQNSFRYPVPVKGASWMDRRLIEYFAPADVHLGLHWFHFEQPILPPIIDLPSHDVQSQPFILVYLPFEHLNDIRLLLRDCSTTEFVCFHPQIVQDQWEHNIWFRPLSYLNFKRALQDCAGVMANGGFELPSEALVLGKKMLLKPLHGQFEQLSNVATLDMLGLASSMEQLDRTLVREWLMEPSAERIVYPDVAGAIVDWLMAGQWSTFEALSRDLWQQVRFPDDSCYN